MSIVISFYRDFSFEKHFGNKVWMVKIGWVCIALNNFIIEEQMYNLIKDLEKYEGKHE